MTLTNEELSIYVEGIQKQIDELNKIIKNGNESKEVSNNEVNSEEMKKLTEEKEYYKKQYEKSEYRIKFLLRKINELETQLKN